MVWFDWELELHHVIYLFVIALTWFGLVFWGNYSVNILYDAIPPPAISTFITVAFWIGIGGIVLGIVLVVTTMFE